MVNLSSSPSAWTLFVIYHITTIIVAPIGSDLGNGISRVNRANLVFFTFLLQCILLRMRTNANSHSWINNKLTQETRCAIVGALTQEETQKQIPAPICTVHRTAEQPRPSLRFHPLRCLDYPPIEGVQCTVHSVLNFAQYTHRNNAIKKAMEAAVQLLRARLRSWAWIEREEKQIKKDIGKKVRCGV